MLYTFVAEFLCLYSRLGHGDIEDEGKALPLRVETIHMLSIHVVSVSCGAEHTIALCQEGVRLTGRGGAYSGGVRLLGEGLG